jgi:hypothetical protein
MPRKTRAIERVRKQCRAASKRALGGFRCEHGAAETKVRAPTGDDGTKKKDGETMTKYYDIKCLLIRKCRTTTKPTGGSPSPSGARGEVLLEQAERQRDQEVLWMP